MCGVGSSSISGLDQCGKKSRVTFISGLLGGISSCDSVRGGQSLQTSKDSTY